MVRTEDGKSSSTSVDSINISEYNCYRNPLKRVETLHKIVFIDVPSDLTNKLQNRKKDEDVEIAIKIETRDIYTGEVHIIMNNVLKCLDITHIQDDADATSALEIFATGVISFNLRKMNSLTTVTLSPDKEEPIKMVPKNVLELFKLFKRQLIEIHGETLGFDLTDEESASDFIYEYIKAPTNIPDIDIFDYVFAHYDGFYFPQLFFVDDCPFGIKTANPPKTNILFRQFDLGAIHKRAIVDIWSDPLLPYIDHGRKTKIFEKPFLNSELIKEDLNYSTRVVTNTQTEELKVYHRPGINRFISKLNLNEEDDFLTVTVDKQSIKKQKNINIIHSFDEYEKIHKGREIFRIGNPPGSKEEIIPKLETWILEDTSPYYLNFGNRYNFDNKGVFDYYPIDMNFKLEKELHSNITFFIHMEVTFYVTPKQDLNQYM